MTEQIVDKRVIGKNGLHEEPVVLLDHPKPIDYQLPATENGYVVSGKRRGKERVSTYLSSDLGKKEADKIWGSIVQKAGKEADVPVIRQVAKETQRWLKTDIRNGETPRRLTSLLSKSIEFRVAHLEREQAMTEMQTSNSPWIQTQKLIKEKLHPSKNDKFVNNFTSTWIVDVKARIGRNLDVLVESGNVKEEDRSFLQVGYENELATLINSVLENPGKDGLNDVKQNGLNQLIEKSLASVGYANTSLGADIKRTTPKLLEWRKRADEISISDIAEEKEGAEALTVENISVENEDIEPDLVPLVDWTSEHYDAGSSTDQRGLKALHTEIVENNTKSSIEVRNSEFKQRIKNAIPDLKDKRKLVSTLMKATGFGILAVSSMPYLSSLIDNAKSNSADNEPDIIEVSDELELVIANLNSQVEPAQKSTELPVPTETKIPATNTPEPTPTSSPTPEPTPKPNEVIYKTPEGQINRNFMIGPVSLEHEFIVGEPNSENFHKIIPQPLSTQPFISDEFRSTVSDYKNYPNTVAVFRSEIERNNLVHGHSYEFQGQPLPFEWIRQLYEVYKSNPDAVNGLRFPLIQDLDGNKSVAIVEIKNMTEVPLGNYIDAGAKYPDTDDPAFYRLDVIGLEDEQRKPGQIQLVTSSGERLPGPETMYSHRVILTAELISSNVDPNVQIMDSNEGDFIGNRNIEIADDPVELPVRAVKVEAKKLEDSLFYSTTILRDAINLANVRNQNHGEEFTSQIQAGLVENNVTISPYTENVLANVAAETENRDLQCVVGVKLAGALPGAENMVNIGGWKAQSAYELLTNPETGQLYTELTEIGKPVEKHDAVVIRINSVSMLRPDDIIIVGQNIAQDVGHAGVTGNVTEENGKFQAEIFDINYDNDGNARIVTITDENMKDILAHGAETAFYVIRKSSMYQQGDASLSLN